MKGIFDMLNTLPLAMIELYKKIRIIDVNSKKMFMKHMKLEIKQDL